MMAAKVRSNTAAVPAPIATPHGRSAGANPRQAKAMTTAVSPESTTLTRAICGTPIQNSGLPKPLKTDERERAPSAGLTNCAIGANALSRLRLSARSAES